MNRIIFSVLALTAIAFDFSSASPISASSDASLEVVRMARAVGGLYCGDVSFSKCNGHYNKNLKCCKNTDKCDNWGGCKCTSAHCCSGDTVKPDDDDNKHETESSDPGMYRHCGDKDVRSDKCGGRYKRKTKCCKHSRKCKGYATLKCSSSHCCAGKVSGNNDDSRDCKGLCHLAPENPHPDEPEPTTVEQVSHVVVPNTKPIVPVVATEQISHIVEPTTKPILSVMPTKGKGEGSPDIAGPTNRTQTASNTGSKKDKNNKYNQLTPPSKSTSKKPLNSKNLTPTATKAVYTDKNSQVHRQKQKYTDEKSKNSQVADEKHYSVKKYTKTPAASTTTSSTLAPSPTPSPTAHEMTFGEMVQDVKTHLTATVGNSVRDVVQNLTAMVGNYSVAEFSQRALRLQAAKLQRILNSTSTFTPLHLDNATVHSILPRFPTENNTVCEERFQYKDSNGQDACCRGNGEITVANMGPSSCCVYPMRRSTIHSWKCADDTLDQEKCDALGRLYFAGKQINATALAACQGFHRDALVRNNRTEIEKVMAFQNGGCPHEGDALGYDYETGMFADACCHPSRMYERKNIGVSYRGPGVFTERLCCAKELSIDGNCHDGNNGFFEQLQGLAIDGMDRVSDLLKNHFYDTVVPLMHALTDGGDVMEVFQNGPAKGVLVGLATQELTQVGNVIINWRPSSR